MVFSLVHTMIVTIVIVDFATNAIVNINEATSAYDSKVEIISVGFVYESR